ncbi:hypothetical protein [Pseudomonas sp. P5_A2_2]
MRAELAEAIDAKTCHLTETKLRGLDCSSRRNAGAAEALKLRGVRPGEGGPAATRINYGAALE